MKVLTGHYPSGGSYKSLNHFLQIYRKKQFCYYDYGAEANLAIYKQTEPKEYDLTKIEGMPIILAAGLEDRLSHSEDVKELRDILKLKNQVLYLELENTGHSTFIVGNDISWFRKDVMDWIKKLSEGCLQKVTTKEGENIIGTPDVTNDKIVEGKTKMIIPNDSINNSRVTGKEKPEKRDLSDVNVEMAEHNMKSQMEDNHPVENKYVIKEESKQKEIDLSNMVEIEIEINDDLGQNGSRVEHKNYSDEKDINTMTFNNKEQLNKSKLSERKDKGDISFQNDEALYKNAKNEEFNKGTISVKHITPNDEIEVIEHTHKIEHKNEIISTVKEVINLDLSHASIHHSEENLPKTSIINENIPVRESFVVVTNAFLKESKDFETPIPVESNPDVKKDLDIEVDIHMSGAIKNDENFIPEDTKKGETSFEMKPSINIMESVEVKHSQIIEDKKSENSGFNKKTKVRRVKDSWDNLEVVDNNLLKSKDNNHSFRVESPEKNKPELEESPLKKGNMSDEDLLNTNSNANSPKKVVKKIKKENGEVKKKAKVDSDDDDDW
jgi:hypothetical protein